ncbi:hypothetical protein ACFVJ8_05125 [Streptomyces yangpuensis]|uniref:hypothetical protein n=1 Tax=Streptomyces yangpuensis TaxID=1648182 RepID=UPI00363DF9F5
MSGRILSLTSADGEHQLVLAVNVYDLGGDPRKERPVPDTDAPGRARTAVMCG